MFYISDLGEHYCKHAAMAVVNGSLWHMLQPLEGDCELNFVRFKDDKPFEVNKVTVLFTCTINVIV